MQVRFPKSCSTSQHLSSGFLVFSKMRIIYLMEHARTLALAPIVGYMVVHESMVPQFHDGSIVGSVK